MGDKKEKQIEWVQDCGESVGELWLTQPLIGIPERKGPLSEGSRRVDVEKIADVERSGRIDSARPVRNWALIAKRSACGRRYTRRNRKEGTP